jgi:hypothetical protein
LNQNSLLLFTLDLDPLGFAKDKATLVRMRDAEIKHSRLAMLAAAGWPLSELWHSKCYEYMSHILIYNNNKIFFL